MKRLHRVARCWVTWFSPLIASTDFSMAIFRHFAALLRNPLCKLNTSTPPLASVCVCVCVVSANHVIYQWMQNSSWKRERERENKNQSNQSNQICDILKWEIQGCGKQAIMALFAADRWICKWNGQEAARLHIASDGLFWVMGLPGRWLNQCDFAISSQGFAIAVDLSEILGHVEHQEKHQFLSVVFSSSFGFHRTRWQFSRLALEMISEEMESNRYRRWFHRWISTGNYEKFSRLIWSIILI